MKLPTHYPADCDNEHLKALLSANEFAKYQGQRTALKRQYRSGRRPPAAEGLSAALLLLAANTKQPDGAAKISRKIAEA